MLSVSSSQYGKGEKSSQSIVVAAVIAAAAAVDAAPAAVVVVPPAVTAAAAFRAVHAAAGVGLTAVALGNRTALTGLTAVAVVPFALVLLYGASYAAVFVTVVAVVKEEHKTPPIVYVRRVALGGVYTTVYSAAVNGVT